MWPIQQKSIAQYCSYLPIIHWPQTFIRVFVGPEHQIHPILVHDFFHAKDMYERNSYTNLQWPRINVLVYKMVKRELWIHTRNLLWILSQLPPRRIYSQIIANFIKIQHKIHNFQWIYSKCKFSFFLYCFILN